MKKTLLAIFISGFTSLSFAQGAPSQGGSAVYGDPSAVPGNPTRWASNHPGFVNNPAANTTEINHYLERASGIPVARKPDPGRVRSYNQYGFFAVDQNPEIEQHPLEGFGYTKPPRQPVVSYADLPQNRGKIVNHKNVEPANWVDSWWNNWK